MQVLKYIIFLTLIFLCCLGKSQYAIGGIPGSLYVDVPDTTLNPPSSSWTSERYSVDMNQDGIKDIRLEAYSGYSPGGSAVHCAATVIDSSFTLSFLRYDSTQYYSSCGSGWFRFATILRPYAHDDTIKNGTYVYDGRLTESGSNMACYSYYDYLWANNNDQYIGVRYTTVSGIQYGWIRVLVSSGASMTIKDHSLGNMVVAIKENSENKLLVYPNPAHDKININGIFTQNGELLSPSGQLIRSFEGRSVAVHDLENGIYFLRLFTKIGVNIQKVIIHH